METTLSSDLTLDKRFLYKPLHKALLPPVVHGQYIPHDAKTTVIRMPSHMHRNHSFTLSQYTSAKFSRALSSTSLKHTQSPPRGQHPYSTITLGERSSTFTHLPLARGMFEPPTSSTPTTTDTNIITPTRTTDSASPSGRAKFADVMDRPRIDEPEEESPAPLPLPPLVEAPSLDTRGFTEEPAAAAPILPTDTKPPLGSERPKLLASTCPVTEEGLELDRIEPGHHATLMSVDCCAHMRRGTRVIKHGRSGKPHTVELRLGENNRFIQWESKKKKPDECVVRLDWVRDIKIGQNSKVFRRNPDPRVAALSLTLYYTRPQRYTHHPDKPVSAGGSTDTSLDLVFEDPNDMCVWFKGLQALVETAHNKLLMSAVADSTLTLSVVLMLPMVTGYPSCDRIEDTRTGLSVAESWENEHAADTAAEGKRHSLMRKETARSIYGSYISVARAKISFNAGATSLAPPQNFTSPSGDSNSDNPSPWSRSPALSPALDAAAATSASPQVQPSLLSPLSDSLPPVEGLDDGFGRQVRVHGESELCHTSWVQQAVALLPRAAQTYSWTCAYRLSSNAAGFEHMVNSVLTSQRKAADEVAASGSARAFGAFLARAAGMSVLLIKTTHGDVIGCSVTHHWERHASWYGTGESVVFRVDHARDEALEMARATPDVSPVELIEAVETTMGGAGMAQMHAYRWCGRKSCRRFQHTTFDGFGIGGAAEEEDVLVEGEDGAEAAAAADKGRSASVVVAEKGIKPQSDGVGGNVEHVPKDEGPAIFVSKDLRHGQSRACPTYESPRLTTSTTFRVLMLELWVPLPQ